MFDLQIEGFVSPTTFTKETMCWKVSTSQGIRFTRTCLAGNNPYEALKGKKLLLKNLEIQTTLYWYLLFGKKKSAKT